MIVHKRREAIVTIDDISMYHKRRSYWLHEGIFNLRVKGSSFYSPGGRGRVAVVFVTDKLFIPTRLGGAVKI